MLIKLVNAVGLSGNIAKLTFCQLVMKNCKLKDSINSVNRVYSVNRVNRAKPVNDAKNGAEVLN